MRTGARSTQQRQSPDNSAFVRQGRHEAPLELLMMAGGEVAISRRGQQDV